MQAFVARLLVLCLLCSQLLVIAGCGRTNDQSNLPPIDDTRTSYTRTTEPRPQQQRPGIVNKRNMVILAGAAALYYMYNKNKNKQGTGPDGTYYLSKNGRVYYRDAQHRAHWVTPPSNGIAVPEQEARDYADFQGYNGRSAGRQLVDVMEE